MPTISSPAALSHERETLRSKLEHAMQALMIGLQGVATLSHITASLATFFIDRDADDPNAAVASEKSIQAVLDEMRCWG